jgi:hypothetical protein
MCLFNRTRGGCLKTTGQIQNLQDFLEAGIAEVPPVFCLFSGSEFGAQAHDGNYDAGES